jgi:predicted dehydrogenase
MAAMCGQAAPVQVAVVGLGFMGVTHLRAHLKHPLARVAAVCDANRAPVNGVLSGVSGNIQQAGDIALGDEVKVYRDFEALLQDPHIDLVDICTPTPLHCGQAVAALRAGKHVLCEKPLARTAGDARELLAATREAAGFLMPAMCMRFWPGWRELKQIVANATYGRVLAARFRRVSEMPAWGRNGTYKDGGSDLGGALFDLHIHDTDFVNFLFGRPASVFSSGVRDAAGAINHVVTQYHYPDGPAVHAEGSWLLAAGFNMEFTLLCERATLDYNLARGAGALVLTETGQAPRGLPCKPGDGYENEIAYFVECVAHHTAPSLVTAQDGVTALEICEAEERSIRTDNLVML